MAELLLLRHSITRGNREGRYIGCRTDEPLCEEGIQLLRDRTYPAADLVFVSPMKRCVETAQLIWENCVPADAGEPRSFSRMPGQIPMIMMPEFRECDFGAFENKNYQELSGNPAYQAWIDSGGTLPFPGGESMESFKKRCREGFQKLVGQMERHPHFARVALVAHGGTIMAVLERFGSPKKTYFDYQVKNGCGYLLTPVEGTDLWNYQCLPWD